MVWHRRLLVVMAGLVPAIHVFLRAETKTWMPGTRPGMTSQREQRPHRSNRSCSTTIICDSPSRKGEGSSEEPARGKIKESGIEEAS